MDYHTKAAALAYEASSDNAPKVVATGKGAVAQQIIKKAKDFNIPMFQNKELVESLLDLEVDTQIPPVLYKGVANVFVWLYQSKQKAELSR